MRRAVCVTKCYFQSKLWLPGDIYNLSDDQTVADRDRALGEDEIPYHFEEVDSGSKTLEPEPVLGSYQPRAARRTRKPSGGIDG